jgi:selenocysteine lyase/cysteine desulfurase
MAESNPTSVDANHELFEFLHDHQVISHNCFKRAEGLVAKLLADLEDPEPSDPEYWQRVRSHYSFSEPGQVIPMNAANLCPRPRALTEALNSLRVCFDENISQQRRTGYFADLVLKTKKRLAQGLGCTADDLVIVRNASEANNTINCGYRSWDSADKVVLWAENHPTNNTAWRLRSTWQPGDESGDPRFSIVTIPSAPGDNWKAIRDTFIKALDKNTRFVSFSETSNGNGRRIPRLAIEAIYEHVEDKLPNCHVHVDGAMSWGAQDIALAGTSDDRLYCHSFSASAHKWFCGPKETGVLYMDSRKTTRFQPSIFAYDYRIKVPDKWQNMPKNAQRFEMLGQRDDVSIIALYFAQLVQDAINSNRSKRSVAGRVVQLGSYLKQRLAGDRWTLITPNDDDLSLAVVRVAAPRKSDAIPSLYTWLYDEAKIAGSGGGDTLAQETFRLCPHIYNTEADIDRAILGMNDWRERQQRLAEC